jgi:iron complex outermembrane recepter protein
MNASQYLAASFRAGLFLSLGAGWGSAAMAADSSASAAVTLEEVTVTAEKRELNLQKTAISITAITGETIDKEGRNDIVDLLKDVPGVSLNNSPGGNYQINIRGIAGGGLPNFDGDPGASINLDGSYNSPLVGGPSQLSFYDVARVEVLRGPQGTLYGRNAESGAVNVVTGNPGKEFAANGTAEFGNYALVRASGMVNVPLSNSWALRVAATNINRDGYFTSGNGGNVGSGGRVKLQFDSGSAFRFLIGADYSKVGGAVGVGGMGNGIPAWGLGEPPTDPYDDITKNGGLTGTIPRSHQNNTTLKSWMQLDWDLGIGTLTVIPSHVRYATSNFVFSIPMGGTAFNYQVFPSNGVGLQDSAEARLTSAESSKLKWIFGGFYLKASNNTFSTLNGTSTVFVDAKSSAVFGQLTWPVSDSLRLIGGLRQTSDKKTFVSSNANLSGFAAPYPGSGGGSWSRSDFKLGIEMDLSASSMLYAHVATGYRPGSVQASSSALVNAGTAAAPIPVPNRNLVTKPEALTAFEVGAKNQFLNNRLRVNADVYLYDYKDRQYSYFTTAAVPTVLCPNGQLPLRFGPVDVVCLIELNANKVRMTGAEIETEWLATENDQLSLSAAILNAKASASQSVTLANPNPPGGVTIIDINGKTLPKAPKLQLNGSYQHSFALAGGKLTPRVDVRYTSKSYLQAFDYLQNIVNAAGYREGDKYVAPAYTIYDLSLNYSSNNDKWNLNAYLKNVDKKAYKTITDGAYTTVGPPQTVGAVLSVRF